jgi:hypothetical protein
MLRCSIQINQGVLVIRVRVTILGYTAILYQTFNGIRFLFMRVNNMAIERCSIYL